jgi:hypothetical protein
MNKLIFALAALGVVGCASAQLPPDQIGHFEAKMSSAKQVRAFNEPAPGEQLGAFGMSLAKEHLELARDQAEVAQTMARAGDARAPLLLARAESDADLALGIAARATMHRLALQASDDLTTARARRVPITSVASVEYLAGGSR